MVKNITNQLKNEQRRHPFKKNKFDSKLDPKNDPKNGPKNIPIDLENPKKKRGKEGLHHALEISQISTGKEI